MGISINYNWVAVICGKIIFLSCLSFLQLSHVNAYILRFLFIHTVRLLLFWNWMISCPIARHTWKLESRQTTENCVQNGLKASKRGPWVYLCFTNKIIFTCSTLKCKFYWVRHLTFFFFQNIKKLYSAKSLRTPYLTWQESYCNIGSAI